MGDLGIIPDELRGEDVGTVEQASTFLKQLRSFTTEKAGDILLGPVRESLGPTGEMLSRSAIEFLNPVPGSVTDAARDAAYIAVLGPLGATTRRLLRAGARMIGAGETTAALGGTALRVGAGAGGAATGAALSGETDPTAAAERAALGLTGGEILGGMGGAIGRAQRQQAADVRDVTSALTPLLGPGQAPLPATVSGIYERTIPKGTGIISDVATTRYRTMLDQVGASIDPKNMRPLAFIPAVNPDRPSTFKEIMDFVMEKTPKAPKGGIGEASMGAKKAYRQKMETREQLTAALDSEIDAVTGMKKSPEVLARDQAAAKTYRAETQAMFKDMTVQRLLAYPGVLAKDGTVNMERLQTAFMQEQKAGRVPADVSVQLQAAFFRGAKPPATDRPAPETFGQAVAGEAGALAGLSAGLPLRHPFMAMTAGRAVGRKLAQRGPLQVGELVPPGPLRYPGQALGIQATQALEEQNQ